MSIKMPLNDENITSRIHEYSYLINITFYKEYITKHDHAYVYKNLKNLAKNLTPKPPI